MFFYYACFASIMLLSAGTTRSVAIRYAAVGVMLFCIAALRGEGVDKDYAGYVEYYENVLYADFINVEPTFIVLANLVKGAGHQVATLFAIYAALSISLKLYAISSLTRQSLTVLLVYYCGFFLLWEMTQIRVAVAGALLLLCIKPIEERKLPVFLAFWLIAAMFHYAAAVIGPLYFLNSRSIRAKAYFALIPLASLLYLANFDLVSAAALAPVQLIELKIRAYETYVDRDVDNIFNYVYLARCALAFVLLANRERLAACNPYFILLLKILFVALFIHVALASIPGISSRLSELLLVVEVLLIPMLAYLFKDRVVGYAVVLVAGMTYLAFSLHYTKLLTPYFINPAFLL